MFDSLVYYVKEVDKYIEPYKGNIIRLYENDGFIYLTIFKRGIEFGTIKLGIDDSGLIPEEVRGMYGINDMIGLGNSIYKLLLGIDYTGYSVDEIRWECMARNREVASRRLNSGSYRVSVYEGKNRK